MAVQSINNNYQWDSLAEFLVQSSYYESLQADEDLQRKIIQLRLSMLIDDHGEALKAHIKSMFSIEEIKGRVLKLMNIAQNTFGDIIGQLSIMYKEPVIREFSNDNEGKAESLYKLLNLDKMNRMVNRRVNAINDVIVLWEWHAGKQLPYPRHLDRTNCNVICEEQYPDIMVRLEYDIQVLAKNKKKVVTRTVVWTDTENFYIEDNKIGYFEGNPKGINPYGVIPAVVMHREEVPGFFWNTTSGADLVELVLLVALRRTTMSYSQFVGDFKMPVAVGDSSGTPIEKEKEVIDPGGVWYPSIGPGGSVEVLDLGGDFSEKEKSIEMFINAVARKYGFTAEAFTSLNASGRALEIKKQGLSDRRTEQIPYYTRYEVDTFDILKLVYNHNVVDKTKQIPDGTEIMATFPQLFYFLTPEDERKFYKQQVIDGVMSPVDYYMKYNPNIKDPLVALKRMQENIGQYQLVYGVEVFNDTGEAGFDEGGGDGENED